MKYPSYIFLSLAASFAFEMSAIDITPGKLAEEFNPAEAENELSVSGTGDVRDLVVLKSLPSAVKNLDISNLKITGYNSRVPAYMGKSMFQSDRLPAYIFFRSECSSITLPNDLGVIEAGAFAASNITSVQIPEGVTEIGEFAFYDCKNLQSVSLPSTLKTIGKGAFSNCPKLTDINLSSTQVTSIPEKCFSGDVSLETLDLFKIKEIGTEAFSNTAITALMLPDVQHLAPYALAGMDYLSELTLNSEAKFNEGTLMNNRNLVLLEGTPANVPPLFAANCVSYTPNDAITNASSIGHFAFSNSGINEVVLGGNLTSVGQNIFHGGNYLTHIDATALESNIPDTHDDAFDGINPADIKLKVSDDSLDAWKAHPAWGQFNIYSEGTTGVENPDLTDAGDGIKIALNKSEISIQSSDLIESVQLWDVAGALKIYLTPSENSVSIPVSELPSGIMVLTVKTTNNKKSVKLII